VVKEPSDEIKGDAVGAIFINKIFILIKIYNGKKRYEL